MDFSKAIVSGRLAGDPQVSYTDKGTMQASFAVVVEKPGLDGQRFFTYIPAIAYGRQAEAIADLSRGARVLLDGELRWQAGSKDGKKPGRLEVFCQQVTVERVPAMAVNEN